MCIFHLCCCLQLQKNLNSFLWLVKRTPPAYLFGTIHVPYTRVWDFIPQNSKDAFERSHYVYFELDLTDTSTVKALWKCQMLPNSGRLKDIIPRSIFKRLQKHLKYIKKMIPIWLKENDPDFPFPSGIVPYAEKLYELFTHDWHKKRPIWVMLMVNSLTESDIKSRGIPVLDRYLAQESDRNEKSIGAVEDVAEQCEPLNSLNNTQVGETANLPMTRSIYRSAEYRRLEKKHGCKQKIISQTDRQAIMMISRQCQLTTRARFLKSERYYRPLYCSLISSVNTCTCRSRDFDVQVFYVHVLTAYPIRTVKATRLFTTHSKRQFIRLL